MKYIVFLAFTLLVGFSIANAQNITIKKILELNTLPAVEVVKFLEINNWVYQQTNIGFLGKENAHVYSLRDDNFNSECLFIVQEPDSLSLNNVLMYQFFDNKKYVQLLKETDTLNLKLNPKYSNLKNGIKVFQDGSIVITLMPSPPKTSDRQYMYQVIVMLETEFDRVVNSIN